MLHVFAWDGQEVVESAELDPSWLKLSAHRMLWVDITNITPAEAAMLATTFKFHELAVEDALAESHHPKVEAYPDVLYLILHGIDFEAAQHGFATHDVDFFVGPNYLVTVHDGTSRSIRRLRDVCPRNAQRAGRGAGCADASHRRRHGRQLPPRGREDRGAHRRTGACGLRSQPPAPQPLAQILSVKRDVMSLRRVVSPQRDVVARLARREFPQIDEAVGYRFRDVYDHLVRLADEAMIFHDRLTGLLDAHLSFVSNRLNEVMKVLTVITTIFMPFTVLVGLYGMNVRLPRLPGRRGRAVLVDRRGHAGHHGVMIMVFRGLKWF